MHSHASALKQRHGVGKLQTKIQHVSRHYYRATRRAVLVDDPCKHAAGTLIQAGLRLVED